MTFLRWHLGLGDAIVCNAIVRHFAKDDIVTIPVYAKNLASVGQMFSDIKSLSVLVVDGDNYQVPSDARIVSLGYFGRNFNPERWDESMYLQCGLDPALRHEGFYAPYDNLCDGVPPSGEYCFAESLFYRGSDALVLSKLPINHAFPKCSIFWWRRYIENATEIECCDCGKTVS